MSDANVGTSGTLTTTAAVTDIGNDPVTGSRFFNGLIDEARIASVARSADWLNTEYNNQSAPGTFETLGSEQVPAGAGNNNFFYFFPR